jgi:uncharacterized protein GlcG (DUF336 family)
MYRNSHGKSRGRLVGGLVIGAIVLLALPTALAGSWIGGLYGGSAPFPPAGCADGVPDYASLKSALVDVLNEGHAATTGFGNPEWAAVVNRDGIVCEVVFSGSDRTAGWPGARVTAAEKASTANALSRPDFALSTANLYYASLPGQSFYGMAAALGPNPQAIYVGHPMEFGEPSDPLVGKAIGGMVAVGGGLPLYDRQGRLIGGLGLSGDTSCADHVIAWRIRHALGLDSVPAGVGPDSTDNMVLDMNGGVSASGFGHPTCKGGVSSDAAIEELPRRFPIASRLSRR